MRIVIADEQEHRAEAVRRGLLGHGFSGEVLIAPSPSDAIAAADVLVATLPGTPHWQIQLEEIRQQRPGMARVVLAEAGDSETVGALRFFDGAHRVLRHPVDPLQLLDAIESIADLRQLLDAPSLRRYVGSVSKLPAAPATYLQLVQATAQDDVTFAQVAEIVERAPALVAQMLRLVNSAYFAPGREITDVRSAIAQLGLEAVGRLVLATEMYGQDSSAGLNAQQLQQMQDRALRVSRLAGRLLTESSYDMVATAGLLSEVGRLLPPPVDLDGPAPDHAEAGAFLLGLWGLPMPIVEAVALHRNPSRGHSYLGFWLTGAVHVAAALIDEEPVDEAYLEKVGVLDRLPSWRLMAQAA